MTAKPKDGDELVGIFFRVPLSVRSTIERGRLHGFHDRPTLAPSMGEYLTRLALANAPPPPVVDPDQIPLPLVADVAPPARGRAAPPRRKVRARKARRSSR